MEVFFSDIPIEGLHLEGGFPESIFELPANDPIRPAGQVHFEADLYAFEEIVAIAGHLHGPFQLQCGACLEYFDYEADFPGWSAEVDRVPRQESFDLADVVREDFLLLLPTHPRCDELVPDRVCPKADLVERFLDGGTAPADPAGERNVWGALDDWQKP